MIPRRDTIRKCFGITVGMSVFLAVMWACWELRFLV